MRKGVLTDAPPTMLDGLIPVILNGHAGKYDTKESRNKPKDHEYARKDAEIGEHSGGEYSAVEKEDAQLGEGDGAGEEDLVGPSALFKMSSCGYQTLHGCAQSMIRPLGGMKPSRTVQFVPWRN